MGNKNFRNLNESIRQVMSNKKQLNEQVGHADEFGWNHLADIVSNWGQGTNHGEVWDSPPMDGVSDVTDILWLIDHWGEQIYSYLEQLPPQLTTSAMPNLTRRLRNKSLYSNEV